LCFGQNEVQNFKNDQKMNFD